MVALIGKSKIGYCIRWGRPKLPPKKAPVPPRPHCFEFLSPKPIMSKEIRASTRIFSAANIFLSPLRTPAVENFRSNRNLTLHRLKRAIRTCGSEATHRCVHSSSFYSTLKPVSVINSGDASQLAKPGVWEFSKFTSNGSRGDVYEVDS